MGKRDRVAVKFPPLLIRLVLGVTMLWAGLGKLLPMREYQPQQLAILANMGADIPSANANDAQETPPPTDVTPGTVPDPEAEVVQDPDLDDIPADIPEDLEVPETEIPSTDEVVGQANHLNGSYTLRLAQTETAASTFAPSDFDGPREMRRLYGIALLLHGSANPGLDDEGNAKMSLVPAIAVQDKNAIILAWASALTEVIAGVMLLIGLLTRLAAFSIVGVMGTAMWLTQIGPAVQNGNATLGFLPAPGFFELNALGEYAWMPFLWQLALFTIAVAVVFSGSGMLGVDRALFHSKARSEDDDD